MLSRCGSVRSFSRVVQTPLLMFNFDWRDHVWCRKNSHASDIWRQRYLRRPYQHAMRYDRMKEYGVLFRNVEPIQLLAFEHTFFHQFVEPMNETDIDIETLYANELVYKHS